MRVDLTVMQVRAIVTMLADELGDDEDLKLDTLEGETDLFEIVRRLLDRMEQEEGAKAALTSQIQDRTDRKTRTEKRIDAHRSAIMALMEAAEVDKLPLPEATCSLRQLAAKLAVNDVAAVPDDYVTKTPKPNMEAIKAAFSPDDDNLPNWLRVEPPKPSLTIRRK